jgi:hypothetical protein
MPLFTRKKQPSANQLTASSAGAPITEQRQQARDILSTTQQPPQSQQQPPQGTQQPQQWLSRSPWFTGCLLLPPPLVIPKPGVAAPISPSPPPFPRYGHALSATATLWGEMYLFGGIVREIARNDLYLFSTYGLSATLVQTYNDIPSPRVGHASAINGNFLIIWGGDTKTDSLSDQSEKQDDGLYLLNLGAFIQTMERRRISCKPQFHESGHEYLRTDLHLLDGMVTLLLWSAPNFLSSEVR